MKPVKIPRRANFLVRQFRSECNKYLQYRSYDGLCTNPANPYSGRARTPFHSYFGAHDARKMGGKGLLSAREISNIVLHQFDDSTVANNNKLREFTTFMGQFLDHSIVLTSNDMRKKSSRQNILVPRNDPRCALGYLHFNRNVKANSKGKTRGPGWRRAINVLSSAVDLFGVYGSERLSKDLRENNCGRMRTSDDGKNLLPRNDEEINEEDSKMNAPMFESRERRKQYFIAGDVRSNENPQLTVFHTLFVRHHNFLAGELARLFPERKCDDDWVFENARRANQVHFQAIIFSEYFEVMTGTKLDDCRTTADGFQCHDQSVDVAISDIFATAAFRVGHTMVGNHIHRLDQYGNSLGDLGLKDAFFSEASRLTSDGIEPYLRGILRHQAQKVDHHIVDALRNLLFENIDTEEGFDLVSLNIQRGRDNNLPSFAKLKQRFLGRSVTQFHHITSDRYLQGQLKQAYKSASKVEAYIGLLCEDHEPGKVMGPTMIAIWIEEFKRLRHGDYYYYQNKNVLPPALQNFPYIINVIEGRGETMRDLILRHTNLQDREVPSNVWKMD